MFKILSTVSWVGAVSGLKSTILRFPLPVTLALLLPALLVSSFNDLNIFPTEDEAFRLAALLLLAIFATLGAALLSEAKGWSPTTGLALSLGLIALLAFRAFTLPATSGAIWSALLLPLVPAVTLLLCCAPFFGRLNAGDAFWSFNFGLWLSVAFGLLVALIVASGLIAFYFTLEVLFEVQLYDKILVSIWFLCLGLLWPIQALAGLPRSFGNPEADYCPTWARHLISYVLVPLTIAFLLLLYAYAIKILVAWSLPQGELGYLVAGYAALGTAVFLLAHPLRKDGNLLVRCFCRLFHPALLVPAILLLLAIAVRIEAYGVTEQRYVVAAFGLWLLLVALAFTVRPSVNLPLMPLSLALILILGSFGPWGSFGLSGHSQIARLEQILERNGLIADGRVARPANPVKESDEAEIYGIAVYLERTGKHPALLQFFEGTDVTLDSPPTAKDFVEAIGLTFFARGLSPTIEYYGPRSVNELDVAPFQHFRQFSIQGRGRTALVIKGTLGRTEARWEEKRGRLIVTSTGGSSVEFDLAALRNRLKSQGLGSTGSYATIDEVTVDRSSGDLHVRLIVEELHVEQSREGPVYTMLRGILLTSEDVAQGG